MRGYVDVCMNQLTQSNADGIRPRMRTAKPIHKLWLSANARNDENTGFGKRKI